MEIAGATFLYTLATLMITFAGFAALLLIIRQAAGAKLSALDRFLTRTTVGHSLALTGGALLPMLLGLYGLGDVLVWKASALIFGLPMLALLLTYPRRRVAATGGPPPPLVLVGMVGAGSLVLIATIVDVLGYFGHAAAAVVSAVTVNFFLLAAAFVIAIEVILRQPLDLPEK
jgi:hypothetical protein